MSQDTSDNRCFPPPPVVTPDHLQNAIETLSALIGSVDAALDDYQPMAEKDEPDGYPTLGGDGKVPLSQLPVGVPALTMLDGDVATTATGYGDVTGLSFPVVAGGTYWFEFLIPYTAASDVTGSKWSISGPAVTRLHYQVDHTTGVTTTRTVCVSAYDSPAGASATSLTDGNLARIFGMVKPSADGAVVARFATGLLASTITARVGAMLRWQRVA